MFGVRCFFLVLHVRIERNLHPFPLERTIYFSFAKIYNIFFFQSILLVIFINSRAISFMYTYKTGGNEQEIRENGKNREQRGRSGRGDTILIRFGMFRACISRRSITGRHYNIGLRINFRVHALRGRRKKDLIHLTCFYSNTGSRTYGPRITICI